MSVRAAVIRPVRMVVPFSASKITAGAKSHIGGALDKGAPLMVVMAGLVPAIHVVASGNKTWMPAPSAGMTKERQWLTAGSTRGWMGAHAPIATVLLRSETSGGIDGFIPTAALAAARPVRRGRRPTGSKAATACGLR